ENTANSESLDAPQPIAIRRTGASDPRLTTVGGSTGSDPSESIVESAAVHSSQKLPAETPAVRMVAVSEPDPVHTDTGEAGRAPQGVYECLGPEKCMGQYLLALFQRTPKRDTVKVVEQRKVTVKKNGKTRTVTKEFTKFVDEDFTWKDPKAAEKAGMSLKDYVIGGIDPSFKLKLYHALRALDKAGLSP